MCGIVGFVNCGNKELLRKSVDVLKHRGPDDNDLVWFDDKKTGLGHTRLSIIDLSQNGHQPLSTSDKRYWIVFNGEIYNYEIVRESLIELGHRFFSKSDTEVLLHAYIEWGAESLKYLNGMFAFAIYDNVSQSIFIARDRLGIKPLYYHNSGQILIFSSEIKAILESGLIKKEPDLKSIHTPIHYQIGPSTGFKNINKLLPGHYINYRDGKITIHKYWDILPSEEIEKTEGQITEELDDLLSDSVRLQMIADVPVGLLLSGGLDSSIIAALMKKYSNNNLSSFTIKFNEADLKKQGNVDDSYYARKVANLLGLNHKEILINPDVVDLLPKMIWHLDEPLADPSAINTYLISKAARDNGIVVLLNGMGGDEIFGGYRSYLACMYADYYRYFPSMLQKLIYNSMQLVPQSSKNKNFRLIRMVKEFLNFATLPKDLRYFSAGNVSLTSKNFNNYYLNQEFLYEESPYIIRQRELFNTNRVSYLTKMCFNDTKVYLPDHNLTYSDKAMMAAGVEGRPPLVDHRIAEFMFKLPPEYRIHKGIQKYILKKVSSRYLPEEIIHRPKAPFSAPMRSWLKGPLHEMVTDYLSEESLKRRGVYNYRYVNKLIENNRSGLEDNSQLIYRLLTNEIWFRTFFN